MTNGTDEQRDNGYQLRLRGGEPDQATCLRLASELRIPPLLSVLLWQRGITSTGAATAFLQPRLTDLPSPFAMKGMDAAVALVVRALQEGWPICIHGDYDVDGVSSSALLALFFQQMGCRPTCYQPDRLTSGYGVQPEFIREHAPRSGHGLLITVDCGISAVEEVRLARELGFKVIVTDHHEPQELLPEADALINPRQADCSFPFPDLAGVGVAFFLALGIRRHLVEEGLVTREHAPNLKQFMDLVALGTVADVMPVTGINRILIRAGLEVMNGQPSPWVSALRRLTGTTEGKLTTEDISFRLAPRINAPGRLGKPRVAFDLLTCTDPVKAHDLAAAVETMNQERRQVEYESLEYTFAECERLLARGDQGLVVQGPYHPGVIGIIASRVAERYLKPVFILTEDTSDSSRIKGSGRSVEGVNLFEILQGCAETLIQFGGHRMAAGLTVTRENAPNFARRFNELAGEQVLTRHDRMEFVVDGIPGAEEVLADEFLQHYQQLEPFGNGNPEPVFLLENTTVTGAKTVKNHLKYSLEVNGQRFQGIGFGLAGKLALLDGSKPASLAIKIRKSVFRGIKRTELHTVDVLQPQQLLRDR